MNKGHRKPILENANDEKQVGRRDTRLNNWYINDLDIGWIWMVA